MNAIGLSVLVLFVGIQSVVGDTRCTNDGGKCQYNSNSCAGGYRSGLCNGARSRQCCLGAGDVKCTSMGGTCQYNHNSCSGSYSRGKCGGPSNRQCCQQSSATGGSCDNATAKRLACSILRKHNSGRIQLALGHPSGRKDNAYPLKNIQDACEGKPASRSSYRCNECRTSPAPGGSVCLSTEVLSYIDSLSDLDQVYVTSIAGACHGCNSRHYRGLAVDLRRQGRFSEFLKRCEQRGGTDIDEKTHIHCQF